MSWYHGYGKYLMYRNLYLPWVFRECLYFQTFILNSTLPLMTNSSSRPVCFIERSIWYIRKMPVRLRYLARYLYSLGLKSCVIYLWYQISYPQAKVLKCLKLLGFKVLGYLGLLGLYTRFVRFWHFYSATRTLVSIVIHRFDNVPIVQLRYIWSDIMVWNVPFEIVIHRFIHR